MKQLKFMIAAAAAIGLAGAAQAGTKTEYYDGSTGFETIALTDGLFEYTGQEEGAVDNESAIIDVPKTAPLTGVTRPTGYTDNAQAKVLQVNTGTAPLLRKLKTGAADAVGTGNITDITIDTLVQFTVTPAGDTVTPTGSDKLMIYLQEVADDEETTEVNEAATNLMVKAGYFNGRGVTSQEYVLNAAVEPGVWYRLTVKSALINPITDDDTLTIPVFYISLGGTELTATTPVASDVDRIARDFTVKKAFPSMLKDSTTVAAVGFAGEGLVDDIVFSRTEVVTSVDFTFTWTDSKISAVTYSIGQVTDQAVTKDKEVTGLDAGSVITLTITPADWYKLANADPITYTVPNATPANSVSLDYSVTEAAKVEEGNKITVSETTAPSDLGIAPGSSFYADKASADAAANLSKAMTWAMKLGGATSATKAAEVVNALVFSDATETEEEQAYLLDCSTDALDGENGEIAKFKFVGFDLANGGFTVGKDKQVGDGNSYGNGYVEVRGSATIDGAYDEPADATQHNFFKAFLVPFAPVAK